MCSSYKKFANLIAACYLAFTGIAACAATANADESVKITRQEVPKAVLDALVVRYPAARANAYARERRDGNTVYEIETTEKSVRRDIIFSVAGAILEVEEAIPPKRLPQVILDSISTNYPSSRVISAEKVTKGTDVVYEAQLSLKKKVTTLVYREDGTLVAP